LESKASGFIILIWYLYKLCLYLVTLGFAFGIIF
jgi:hypothetical protein